jgi:hypothetical protein
MWISLEKIAVIVSVVITEFLFCGQLLCIYNLMNYDLVMIVVAAIRRSASFFGHFLEIGVIEP